VIDARTGDGTDCVGVNGGQGSTATVSRFTTSDGADDVVLFGGAAVGARNVQLGDGSDSLSMFSGALINSRLSLGDDADAFYVAESVNNVVVNGDVNAGAETNAVQIDDTSDAEFVLINGELRVARSSAAVACAFATQTLTAPYLFIRDGVVGCTGATTYVGVL